MNYSMTGVKIVWLPSPHIFLITFLPVRSWIKLFFPDCCVQGTFTGAGGFFERNPDASVVSYICFSTDIHVKGLRPLIKIIKAQRYAGQQIVAGYRRICRWRDGWISSSQGLRPLVLNR